MHLLFDAYARVDGGCFLVGKAVALEEVKIGRGSEVVKQKAAELSHLPYWVSVRAGK